jgi:mannose-6-phosphate isomerase-like protein (cupin superfamily)
VTVDDSRLDSLRRRIEETEEDLRALGYSVDRCVTPPGVRLSNQIFDERCMILVLFGRLQVTSNEETVLLAAGDRVEIPSGVPYALEAEGDVTAYWLHARILEETPSPEEGRTVS